MSDYQQKIFNKMSHKLQCIYKLLSDCYGERCIEVAEIYQTPEILVGIKLGDTLISNEIYGDIKEDCVHLKCSSGPNILNKTFIDTLTNLYDILATHGYFKLEE